MDAAFPAPDAPLPDDVAELKSLVRQLLAECARLREENARLRAENTQLQAKLDATLKHRFGRRSERQPRRREAKPDDDPGPSRDPHGRAALPAHLPRHEVVHDLSEAEKRCPCCGQPRTFIGTQASEQLDLEPARFFVLRTLRKSYAYQHCDPACVPAESRLQTADPSQVGPIPKGLCGPGLLAQAITAKYADHVPLHRLAGQLARSGVKVPCSTLGGWMRQAADLLEPLVGLMHERLLRSRVIHSDDTGVKLPVKGADQTKKVHLWAYLGDADFPYVVFDFTVGYTATGPARFLGDYEGYLQADALPQYEGLYATGRVKHVCCWAHARRKFVAAAETGDARAEAALVLISRLYAIERTLPALLAAPDEPGSAEARRAREEQRRRERQSQAGPVLREWERWLQQGGVLPKSLLGVALTYARNNAVALGRYLEAGNLGSTTTGASGRCGRSHWDGTTGAWWAAKQAGKRRRCCTRW